MLQAIQQNQQLLFFELPKPMVTINSNVANGTQLIKETYGYQLVSTAATALKYTASKKKWQVQRRNFIGGSDAGGVANGIENYKTKYGISEFSKYATPFTVYYEKVNNVEIPYNKAMARGNRREAGLRAIAAREIMAAENIAKGVKVYASKYTYTSNERHFMGANLDGFVVHPEHGLCGLEIKTGNDHQIDKWVSRAENNLIPGEYYAQVQHYMYVMGFQLFYVLAEIGDDVLLRKVERNDAFIADLINAEQTLYNMMQRNEQPNTLGFECENKYLKTPCTVADVVTDDSYEDIAGEYLLLKKQLKELEEEQRRVKAELEREIEMRKQAMIIAIGEHEGLKTGNYYFSYKSKVTNSFDKAQFELDYPELAQNYYKSITTRTFIKRKVA